MTPAERTVRDLAVLLFPRGVKVHIDDTYTRPRVVWISWPTEARRFPDGEDDAQAWAHAAEELKSEAASLIQRLQTAMVDR